MTKILKIRAVEEGEECIFSPILSNSHNSVLIPRRPFFDLNEVKDEMKNFHFPRVTFDDFDYREKVTNAFSSLKKSVLSKKALTILDKLHSDSLLMIEESFKITPLHRPFEVSLNYVENVPCTKFHGDFLPLRLLCTYHGPGTIYLHPKATRYACLNQGSSNKRVLVKGEEALETKPFELLLLK